MVSHQTLVDCLQFSPWPSAKDPAHLTASPSRLQFGVQLAGALQA